MDKNGVVTFKDWQKGQKTHPIYGMGLLQNVEINENPGIVKLAQGVTQKSITVSQLPIAYEKDIYGNEYIATGETGAGSVYKNGSSIQSGLANLWDIKIYKDYLWVRHANVMSCYGPLSSGGAQWFGNIATGFSSSYRGVLLVGQDDYIYSGNGNYVAKIEVTASGTPGVAPTLNTNLIALDLKDGQYVSCLAEYNTSIVIGTGSGSSYSDMANNYNAKIYFWNRQLGTLGNPGLADLPINFNENGIHQMISHANRLFVVAGTQGNVYETDSTSYAKVGQIPFFQNNKFARCEYFPNAISISSKGTLLIGVSTLDQYSKAGVYEIDISNASKPISLKQTISTGTVSTASGRISIGFIIDTNFNRFVGWRDVNTYGVDELNSGRLRNNYTSIIETDMVKVGSFLAKKTFENIEFSLVEPLVSGQSIKLSYRKNNKEDYTLIGTYDFTTQGSVLSWNDICAIHDAEFVQLKIELDQSLLTIYGSNINLLSVAIW